MSNTIGMEAIVEIDENERYWMGNGFGKGGLLPTDRGPFSSTDGSMSWKSMKEASEDLLFLGRGWKYKENEAEFLPTNHDDPETAWLYAADFRQTSINDAKPNQGNLHFVRFRRLIRTKVFNPEEFASTDVYRFCDHCDSVETDSISNMILDVIAYVSMLHNKAQATDTLLLPLKKTIIDVIATREVSSADVVDAITEINLMRKEIMFLIEKERSKTSMGRLMSDPEYLFAERHKWKEFHERCSVVEASCLPKSERDAIAGLIVRRLDPRFQLHCNKPSCGDDCRFFRIPCPHEGCHETMSRSRLEYHDALCVHKIVTCACGDVLKAGDLATHKSSTCKMRLVNCPFGSVGCTVEIKAGEVEQHVLESMPSHLLLAIDIIHKQKEEIEDLRGSIVSLQAENQALFHCLIEQKEKSSRDTGELEKQLTKLAKHMSDFERTVLKNL